MDHKYQDRCSLEFGRIIAAGLPEHPEWLQHAKANLARWSERNNGAPGLLRCYREWLEILERPVREICDVLTAETDEGQRLRQNSPFGGVIPFETVWGIKQRIRVEMGGVALPYDANRSTLALNPALDTPTVTPASKPPPAHNL